MSMKKSLVNQNGIKISELAAYIQAWWTDNGCDGAVKIAIDSGSVVTIEQVVQIEERDILLLARTNNPCIDVYYNPKYVKTDGSHRLQQTACSNCGCVGFYSDTCCWREKGLTIECLSK